MQTAAPLPPLLPPGVTGGGVAGTELLAEVAVPSLLWAVAELAAPLLSAAALGLAVAAVVPLLPLRFPGVGRGVAAVPGSAVARQLLAGWAVGWASVLVVCVAGLVLEARPVRVLAGCAVAGRISLLLLLPAAVADRLLLYVPQSAAG